MWLSGLLKLRHPFFCIVPLVFFKASHISTNLPNSFDIPLYYWEFILELKRLLLLLLLLLLLFISLPFYMMLGTGLKSAMGLRHVRILEVPALSKASPDENSSKFTKKIIASPRVPIHPPTDMTRKRNDEFDKKNSTYIHLFLDQRILMLTGGDNWL